MVARILLDVIRPKPFVLLATDKPLGLLRWPLALINLVFPYHPLDQSQLVVAVQNLEVLRQPSIFPVRTQQSVRDTMKGAEPKAAGRNVHHLLDAVTHFLGGLVGEGHRQDSSGRHPIHGHQPGDPVHQNTGFATSCAGQNQKVIVLSGNSFTLGIVQRIDDVGDVHKESVRYWLNKQVYEYNRRKGGFLWGLG